MEVPQLQTGVIIVPPALAFCEDSMRTCKSRLGPCPAHRELHVSAGLAAVANGNGNDDAKDDNS